VPDALLGAPAAKLTAQFLAVTRSRHVPPPPNGPLRRAAWIFAAFIGASWASSSPAAIAKYEGAPNPIGAGAHLQGGRRGRRSSSSTRSMLGTCRDWSPPVSVDSLPRARR